MKKPVVVAVSGGFDPTHKTETQMFLFFPTGNN